MKRRMKVTMINNVTQSTKTKTKADILLSYLEDGNTGTMDFFAKYLNTSRDGVRAHICTLRNKGYQIFNRPILGTRKTEYFIPSRRDKGTVVKNKARISMVEEHGTYVL
jgi:biotin operon repressor